MTEHEVIERVMRVVEKQVGYSSGNPRRSKYAQNGWQGLWCARGISTCVMWALGVPAGNAAIGRQGGMTVGWAATWLWLGWFRRNREYPGYRNAVRGDILMMRFPNPSGGRSKNPTNHVEILTADAGYDRQRGWFFDTVGFNSVASGRGGGRPGEGATVSRQRRYLRSGTIVGTHRPDWGAAAKIIAKTERYEPVGMTTEQVQAVVGVTVDGDYGPKTRTAVARHQRHLDKAGFDPGPADGLWGSRTTRAHKEYNVTLQRIEQKLDNLQDDVDQLRTAEPAASRADVREVVKTEIMRVPRLVWSYVVAHHGPFNAWWFLRRGLVLDPEHRRFPADPGSPADIQMQVASKTLGAPPRPYTAAVAAELDEKENTP